MMNYLFILICTLILMTGCTEKKEKSNVIATENNATIGKIEVVENTNYKEEKVAVKAKDSNESKVFYYDYNQDKSTQNQGVDEKHFTPIEAALNVRSPYEHIEISMLVSKLSKNFMVKCSACHDDYANGIIGPSLLSKDSNYIYETIMKYKTGEKENILMKELVKNIDDKEIKSLANEIHTFNQEIKKIKERQK
ncbi:MAG: c-type cytochrome [Sulfurospirillum sp.]